MDINDIQIILRSHSDFWNSKRGQMRELTDAYLVRMFKDHEYYNGVTIETSDAYSYVETLVASTFSKAPSLEVGSDPQGQGDHNATEACINQFLSDKVDTCERGLRYALIYPMSFFKLALRDADSLLNAIEIRALKPWDVIVDFDAECWEDMRYCGHKYSLPIGEAKRKFPNIRFNSNEREDFLSTKKSAPHSQPQSSSKFLGYVEIVELYDLVDGEVTFYCENLDRKNKILSTDPMAFSDDDGTPMLPIVPCYLSYAPDYPLHGFSTLGRVYDQLWEINNLRTEWANGVRRNSRQYVARAGSISTESMEQLTANIDQAIIEIDVPPGGDVRTAIHPLYNQQMSPDFSIYKNEIMSDLQRGSILAPFTSGSVTQATATEIEALTQYTATELGRIARFYHLSMERIGRCYRSLAHFYLDTVSDRETEIVMVYNKPMVLNLPTFEGKFRYSFADQSTTPMTDALKRRTLMELSPILGSLGADQRALLKYLAELHELPESIVPEPAAEEAGPVGGPALPGPGAPTLPGQE